MRANISRFSSFIRAIHRGTTIPSLDSIHTVPLVHDLINTHSSNEAKDRSPIVMLHGLFGNKTSNRTLCKHLNKSTSRDVYSLDLRNHGDSPRAPNCDYASMAADVGAWVQRNVSKPPIILGHSMGAKVAMLLALMEPKHCHMVVSLENAPIPTPPLTRFLRYLYAIERIVAKEKCTRDEAFQELRNVETDEGLVLFLMTLIKRNNDGYLSRLPLQILKNGLKRGFIEDWPLQTDTISYKGPALFIRGTLSSIMPDECIPVIGNFFPKFELRDAVAGHNVTTDAAAECSELITDFISRNED
ncbi:HFL016Cp [Eremothecium sinecaudum]|uniref:HFL016Cp n=1 Tax=Eremothecium sinecaudum TaxID=45286 RepID=A0A109UZR7_9SACH|nr:HFL016Cp [Eremothecium sinecaudum]AMD21840.1 HFL016Cp [Eremothecium sinecaudum]